MDSFLYDSDLRHDGFGLITVNAISDLRIVFYRIFSKSD